MNALEEPRQSVAARSVIMGTAGHIDHGKTALVLALTGTDTDRLPEEKARGITIDLGFAALDLQDEKGRTAHLGLVDVPGHHAFIHNMLAGAGGIDCLMLVVAADEGVKAQTVEHLDICTLLGVRYGVIALTKRDVVSAERLEAARREVRNLVKGTFLEHAAIMPVSALTGEGIGQLKSALLDVALGVPEHGTDTLLRLPLDRAFSITGFGTVVTGTLRDGSLHAGDVIELQPAAREVRVRGLQVHHRAVKEAHAPARVALNLAGIEVGDIQRGDTIVARGGLAPVSTVDVELTVLPGKRALRHRSRTELYAFTSKTPATVLLYESDEEGATGLARLRLSKPMLMVPGDRFVLRMPAPAGIIGGGRVLDAYPMRRLRKAQAREWLNQIRGASTDQQIFARVQRRGMEGISLGILAQETGLRDAAIGRLLEASIATGRVIATTVESAHVDRFIDSAALSCAIELLFKELMRKESRSSARAELLSRTRLPEWVFDLGIGRLVQTGPVRVTGSEIAIIDAGSVGGKQSQQLTEVEELYRSSGLAAPLVAEAAITLKMASKDLPQLITQLLRTGKLVRMGSDTLMIHADALSKLKADLGQLRGQKLDVPRFKEFTGLTRKHAIPILEYLDRMRVTANNQGIRTVL